MGGVDDYDPSKTKAAISELDRKRRVGTVSLQNAANQSFATKSIHDSIHGDKKKITEDLELEGMSAESIHGIPFSLQMVWQGASGSKSFIRENWQDVAIMIMYMPGRMSPDVVESMYLVVRVLTDMPDEVLSHHNPISLMKSNPVHYEYLELFNLAAVIFHEVKRGILNGASVIQNAIHQAKSSLVHGTAGAALIVGLMGSTFLAGLGSIFLGGKLASRVYHDHTLIGKRNELMNFLLRVTRPRGSRGGPIFPLAEMAKKVQQRKESASTPEEIKTSKAFNNHYQQLKDLAKSKATTTAEREEKDKTIVQEMLHKGDRSDRAAEIRQPLLLTGSE